MRELLLGKQVFTSKSTLTFLLFPNQIYRQIQCPQSQCRLKRGFTVIIFIDITRARTRPENFGYKKGKPNPKPDPISFPGLRVFVGRNNWEESLDRFHLLSFSCNFLLLYKFINDLLILFVLFFKGYNESNFSQE